MLAKFGQLEILEYIYEHSDSEEYPSLDGYNMALENDQTEVIEWMKEMSADANYVINPSKLEWKLQPSLIRTVMQALGF